MLAILGRGIQMLDPKSDPTQVESYALTEDLEVCADNSAHLPVRVPAADKNPLCLVGGGELNLFAGMELYQQCLPGVPDIIVCAYGHQSDYLTSVGGPSESDVMSHRFLELVPDTTVEMWPPDSEPYPASGTNRELMNIYDLALKRGLERIAIVTVGVHVPRTATYVAKHFSVHEKYRALSPVVFESEEVLLSSSEEWRPRVEALRNSAAFARTSGREAEGIWKIIRDVYDDAKPKVETN